MCCTYLQVLFHVLQMLNAATTGSMEDIKPICDFITNVPQHVVVHHVDCSCYLICYYLACQIPRPHCV